ncbi:EamA family transporter [Jatrophihabitans endophyticus]|nr:EamA family transporter [Jatrophihabitans endophyticus]
MAGPGSRDTATGSALAVVSVLSVQFGAAVAASLFDRIGALGAVALRLTAASLVLVTLTRPWRRVRTRADLEAAFVFGAVFAGMHTTLYLAIERLPLATVVTLEFLGPLGVAIVTARSWTTRVWALPAAVGVALLAGVLPGGDPRGGDLLGVGFALSTACCWAGYIVLSGRLGRSGTGPAGLAVGCAAGAVVMLPVGAATAGADLLQPQALAVGLAVGVLSSAIPYSLDLLALRRLPTAVFGVLTSLNPAVAALAGFVLLVQTPSRTQLGGIALVTLASGGVTIGRTVRTATARRAVRRRPLPHAGPESRRSPNATRLGRASL